MFLEKINNLLLSWVSQGIFSEFWYYIQEFSNYEIIISLEGLNGDADDSVENKIVVGRLNNSGFYDIDNKLRDKPFPFTPGHNFNYKLPSKSESRKKEYEEFYGYQKELQNNFVEVGLLLSRKIDELFWLILKSNKLFEPFVGTLQWNVNDDNHDCYLLFSSSTYLKDLDENYRSDIFGVDCDELDNYLDLSPSFMVATSKKSEELLDKYKRIIKSEPDRLNIDLLSPALNNDLSNYEDSFSNNIVDDMLVIDYHSLIEKFIIHTFKKLESIINQNSLNDIKTNFPNISKQLTELKDKFNRNKSYRTKLDFRIKYLKFLYALCQKISKDDEIDSLESKLSEIIMYSRLGFQRNQLSHGNKISLEKKIHTIKGYRFILELLSQYFQSIRNILN